MVSWRLLLYISFVAHLQQFFSLLSFLFWFFNLCALNFYEELTFREKQLTAQRFLVFPCCLKNPKIKVITLHQTRLISAACCSCACGHLFYVTTYNPLCATIVSASVRPSVRQLVAFIAFSMKNNFFTCFVLRSVLTSPLASALPEAHHHLQANLSVWLRSRLRLM